MPNNTQQRQEHNIPPETKYLPPPIVPSQPPLFCVCLCAFLLVLLHFDANKEHKIDKKATNILIFCRSGRRAGVALEVLEQLGCARVLNGQAVENVVSALLELQELPQDQFAHLDISSRPATPVKGDVAVTVAGF